MKKVSLFFCVAIILSSHLNATKRRILFIGNSYTSVNNLPDVLYNLALSMGDTLEVEFNIPGGATFNQHSNDATTLAKIQLGNWDYVVLQAQSQEPSFPPSQVQSNTYPYAKKLDSLIHVSNPCAETIFYMTWGKKNGDASNCASYPVICTYAGVYSRLRESYLEMTADNNATCAPVGISWDRIINNNPNIELFNADGSHPNINGTYLTACTFYATIYQKACVGAQYIPAGVGNSDANLFQIVASATVLDSLENWQQYGGLPSAKFTSTPNGNLINFTNLSLRSALYEWDFGDGTAINTTPNPTHAYATNGIYTVKLKSFNVCEKYDTYSQQISVNNAPNEVIDMKANIEPTVFYKNENLNISLNETVDIFIFNSMGQLIISKQLKDKNEIISFSNKGVGVYYYKIKNKQRILSQGKFIVN